MNGTSAEKSPERARAESYAAESRAMHDARLEQAFGMPRRSRDMEEENPSAVWAYRRAVDDRYDSFELINRGEVARLKRGEMKLEDAAAERVIAANAAEARIARDLERGAQEISDADIALVSGQFKIHLQPRKEYAAEVFSRLVECLADDEELRALIPIFKASVAENPMRDREGQSVPEVVLYTPSYDAMQKALDKLQRYFAGWEEKGSGDTPRFNWKINSLIYAAQSGADFKNALQKHDMLDAYYDENYGYAFRRGTGIYSREPIRVIRKSESFDDLYMALDKMGGLVGSRRPYSSKELKAAIEGVRRGKLALRAITESGGLHDKVEELLAQDNSK